MERQANSRTAKRRGEDLTDDLFRKVGSAPYTSVERGRTVWGAAHRADCQSRSVVNHARYWVMSGKCGKALKPPL